MSTGYNNRVSWDDYCFEIASVVSRRSTCPRAAMGAVLTKHRQIIGTGYNGAAPGLPHCLERNQTLTQHLEIDHCAWAIHAERNAVYNTFVQVDGATLYVVGPRPICPDCRDYLSSRGVTDIRVRRGIATLDSLAHDIRGWQTVTFPQATPASVALHLRREAAELACAPSDPEEIADIFHLLVAAAEANGYDLIDIVAAKFTVNLARRWQAPDSTGVVEHVREVAP
jgi:dCMP deaminase